MKTIFKQDDPVYDPSYGWGEVSEILTGNQLFPIGVQYEFRKEWYLPDGKPHPVANKQLSFTKYDLVNGGFSQERPKPEIKLSDGQWYWWRYKNECGIWMYSKYYDILDYSGIEISVTNPHLDSLEARAIELIRKM